jgi:CheY-like chemotaxis protein
MLVLIVEDDEECGASIAEVLSEHGLDVIRARSAADALQLLADGPRPDVILLDLIMPNMDGEEFRRRQLARPEWSQIPVVVMSGRPDIEVRAARLRLSHFLRKPMSIEVLVHTVTSAVAPAWSAVRRSERQPFCANLDVIVAGQYRWARGRTLSLHGACFQCEVKVALGDALEVDFTPCGGGLRGAVVRYTNLEESRFTVGVEFFEPLSTTELETVMRTT